MNTSYLEVLKKRKKESRAYTPHQAMGAEIAEILGDEAHTALYIKLAKEHDAQALLRLAKDVATRHGVDNKGAYFMKIFHEDFNDKQQKR